MAIRKSNDIANESDSRYNKVKDTKSREKITKRFDSDTHNPYPGDEALQYLAKKIDDIIDETNKGTTASGSYAAEIKTLIAASSSYANTGANRVTIKGNISLSFSLKGTDLNISDGTNMWTLRARL
jgi:hypothetical protein